MGELGDGQTGASDTVIHTYVSAGMYTVRVTVTGEAMQTAQVTAPVTVQWRRPRPFRREAPVTSAE
jgi:PKD repeat protein